MDNLIVNDCVHISGSTVVSETDTQLGKFIDRYLLHNSHRRALLLSLTLFLKHDTLQIILVHARCHDISTYVFI